AAGDAHLRTHRGARPRREDRRRHARGCARRPEGGRGLPGRRSTAGGEPLMLTIQGLDVSYGAIRALQGVSLEVPEGAIVTLIGGNGAGKSTTLRTVSGLIRPQAGTIT